MRPEEEGPRRAAERLERAVEALGAGTLPADTPEANEALVRDALAATAVWLGAPENERGSPAENEALVRSVLAAVATWLRASAVEGGS